MKAKKTKLALWICAIVVLLVASILVPSVQKTETIQVTMRDAVLHETNRISLFGIKDVNPALISAMVVSGILLVFAVIVRIFVIPRFKMVPGKFQMLLEQAVDLFDGMAKSNSPGRSGFLGCIPDPVDQVCLNKAVNIFIFICNLKCSVFHILTDSVQSVNDLLLLILSQNSLLCKHCHMCNTSSDILLIESLVERDGCVKIINQLICLFCKTTAP